MAMDGSRSSSSRAQEHGGENPSATVGVDWGLPGGRRSSRRRAKGSPCSGRQPGTCSVAGGSFYRTSLSSLPAAGLREIGVAKATRRGWRCSGRVRRWCWSDWCVDLEPGVPPYIASSRGQRGTGRGSSETWLQRPLSMGSGLGGCAVLWRSSWTGECSDWGLQSLAIVARTSSLLTAIVARRGVHRAWERERTCLGCCSCRGERVGTRRRREAVALNGHGPCTARARRHVWT